MTKQELIKILDEKIENAKNDLYSNKLMKINSIDREIIKSELNKITQFDMTL